MEIESVTAVARPVPGHSDNDLETIVKRRLNGRVNAFQLIAEKSGLVLRGQCHTFHAKQIAQHLVMETSALPILANEIEVAYGDEP